MGSDQSLDADGQSRSAAKRVVIHAAAIQQFSERGFAGTSMANIAEAAGMSRPALYQYFQNKGDIFASAFIAVLDEHVGNALAALGQPGSTADQLDGFLQRYEGDLWERMSASPHTDEINSAKNAQVSDAIATVVARLWEGMAAYLEGFASTEDSEHAPGPAEWLELLQLSPKGFRFDHPSVDTYRRRLTTLARSVAADIGA